MKHTRQTKHECQCRTSESREKRICKDRLPLNDLGQTELHILCQDPNTELSAISNFHSRHPQTIYSRDIFGRTPLFHAIKYHLREEIVMFLFFECPESIIQRDFCGETGMFMLYQRTRDIRLLEMVLNERPEYSLLEISNLSKRSLMDVFCEAWTVNDILPTKGCPVWTKQVLTVLAAYRWKNSLQLSEDEALHVALEMGLDSYLLCKYVHIYPEQLSEPMKRQLGSLPSCLFMGSDSCSYLP